MVAPISQTCQLSLIQGETLAIAPFCVESDLRAWAARDFKHVCFATRSKNHKKRQTQQKTHPTTGYETDFGLFFAETWRAG